MPNWCTTHYTFIGKIDEITEFYRKINNWIDQKPLRTSGFGQKWLGNLLLQAGIDISPQRALFAMKLRESYLCILFFTFSDILLM